MTSKKSKTSKSDSRSKKRSHTASSNSSNLLDDKKSILGDIQVSETVSQLSRDEFTLDEKVMEDTVAVETIIDSFSFNDLPTLTELIIERYDGEKSNGRFEGLGTAFFVNGNIYEGMFCEGTMHGTGRFNWKSTNTSYEGDFLYNEISGKGKYIWSDGSSYEGDVVHGIRHGRGIYKHPSGMMYSGLWINGNRHGNGTVNYDTDQRSFYEGDWNHNVIEGFGFRQYRSGNTYEGEWYKGKRHGHGVMKWLDRNEQYTGQWKNGIQYGMGQHIWYVQRIKGSQYSLRNVYEGEFSNGKRHGWGCFTYPSGARYEGYWVNNKKCGKGEFVFKNGRIYEGEFEDDKIKEFPFISVSGRDSPDLNIHKTQQLMQDDIDNMSARLSVCSFNTVTPSFQLYLVHILMDPQITNPDEESIQIHKAVLTHLGMIRKIHQFYSTLGETISVDNTSVMTQMQFWRFLKDCRLHYNSGPTISELDRALASSETNPMEIMQNPLSKITFLRFINYLISVAYYVYSEEYINDKNFSGYLLDKCFESFMTKNVLPYACNVGGVLYSDSRKTNQALSHFNEMLIIYKEFSYSKQDYPQYYSMKMRDFLIMMKNLNLINSSLTATEIVKILSLDDPNVTDDQFVCLEIEITFYEFYEAMINCATKFITKDIIDIYLKNEDKKTHQTNMSENLEDSETERTLTISRPITGDSNKLDFQDDDKSNVRNHGKPQSGKNKVSSADSSNSKTRKQDTDKTGNSRSKAKNVKSSKPVNNRSRKMSVDKESVNATKQPVASNSIEMLSIPEVNLKDDESLPDSFSQTKTLLPELENLESSEERKFNFWTHQLHMFFCNFLFPSATKYAMISKVIHEKDSVLDTNNNLSEFLGEKSQDLEKSLD